MKKILLLTYLVLPFIFLIMSCDEDNDVPPAENEEEIITDAVLTFTPLEGGNTVIARAEDPDGEGPEDMEILDDIVLAPGTRYILSIELENAIEGESISDEVAEEADEHMFFFSWSEGLFSSPTGDGNIDNRADDLGYNDADENGLPLGLLSGWTTSEAGSGTFRIMLKHQPDIKSATSTSSDGETDVDLTWDIVVE